MKPAVLAILDGWGIAREWRGNAITKETAPTLFTLARTYPSFSLQASGVAVGLPWAEPGNSEVGHLTIGSGRIIPQYLPRILEAISDGSFFENPALKSTANAVKENKGRLHLAGLVSSGSVHAYLDHLYGLLEFARREGLTEVYVHVFTDGRDGPLHEARTLLPEIEARMRTYQLGRIASIVGRDYAMDRHQDWALTHEAYKALTGQTEKTAATLAGAIAMAEGTASDDARFPAIIIRDTAGAVGALAPNDALIFFNFREDSMRQIASACFDTQFDHFARPAVTPLFGVTLTAYNPDLPVLVAFPPPHISATLASVLAANHKTQLHVAEDERFAHITTFFNAWQDQKLAGETDVEINAQSSEEGADNTERIAAHVVRAIREQSAEMIVVNFAAADIAAHLGDPEATKAAVSQIDRALDAIATATLAAEGALFIAADHGHSEEVFSPRTNEIITEHTSYPIRFIVVDRRHEGEYPVDWPKKVAHPDGLLSDIAPTILAFFAIPKPLEMTGSTLMTFGRPQ